MNMTAIIITAIICATVAFISTHGGSDNDKKE